MIAGLIDRRLQLLAQLRETLETLLVGEILVQRIFHHRVYGSPPQLVIVLINTRKKKQTPYRDSASGESCIDLPR